MIITDTLWIRKILQDYSLFTCRKRNHKEVVFNNPLTSETTSYSLLYVKSIDRKKQRVDWNCENIFIMKISNYRNIKLNVTFSICDLYKNLNHISDVVDFFKICFLFSNFIAR